MLLFFCGGGRLFQVGANSRLSGYWNKNGIYKNHAPKNFHAFPVIFDDPSLNGFKLIITDKILKSD